MGQLSSSTKGRRFNEADAFRKKTLEGTRTFDSGRGRGILRHNNLGFYESNVTLKIACAVTTLRTSKTRTFSEPKFVTSNLSKTKASKRDAKLKERPPLF